MVFNGGTVPLWSLTERVRFFTIIKQLPPTHGHIIIKSDAYQTHPCNISKMIKNKKNTVNILHVDFECETKL